MSSKLLPSGISVGVNIAEAQAVQSSKDFIAKMSFALDLFKEEERNHRNDWIKKYNQKSSAKIVRHKWK